MEEKTTARQKNEYKERGKVSTDATSMLSSIPPHLHTTIVFTLILSGLWLSGGFFRLALPEQANRAEGKAGLEVYEKQAAASLVGEFRSSFVGYLWAKTDEYLHGGVHLRPMTEREKAQGAHRASSQDSVQTHEGFETSTIPEASRDPRGIWGEIERQVKPYYDVRGHKHRDPKESLPLFRFMTWVDPTFVPGYVTGAQVILFSDKSRGADALDYLREGVRYNPNSIALNTEMARILMVKQHAFREAEPYLLKAVGSANANQQSEFEQESLQDAYRWLVLLYRETSQHAKAKTWAHRGVTLFPDDPVLNHTLKGKGIHEIELEEQKESDHGHDHEH